jgi:serine/threonine protein kinase
MAVKTGLLPDRYTGAQPIGRGGMGEIYRATDTTLGRAVAIKVLDQRYAEDEAVRQRFTREALAVARLSGNPSIVTIYDVGEYRERPYIVMEYLAGGSLQERIKQGPVPPGQALEWLEQAAAALDAAHREGVIHRDVKPANLLLDRHERMHVADFGIASAAGLDSLTQTGTVLGTASYLSPEQAKGERTTPASDLYSLAVVAFELLTGRRPFEGDSMAAEAAAHVTGEIPSVCEVNPEMPCELDPVFARALAKDPARRYRSAAEFVAALRASIEEAAGATRSMPVTAPRYPGRPPAPAFRRSRPSWLVPLLGAIVLALFGAGLAYALTRGGDSNAKPAPVRVTTRERTVTGQSRTVVRTVVTTAPAPAPPPTTHAAPTTTSSAATTSTSSSSSSGGGVGGDPYGENNRAWELMKAGAYAQALPLLQDAVRQLNGRSDLGTAYAEYNLGYTLMQLGRCGEAVQYLEASRAIQPNRKEVKDALKQAQSC